MQTVCQHQEGGHWTSTYKYHVLKNMISIIITILEIMMIIIMIIIIIVIKILIVIDSYIIIKDEDNDSDDEKNTQNKDNRMYINKKIESCKWSFLTITITVTTGKTLTATDKTLTGEEKKTKTKTRINNIYYIQTIKRLACLICSVNMFIKTKRGMYVFNLWYQYNSFCLKDFTISAWSVIVISQSQILLWSKLARKTLRQYQCL